MSEKNESIQEYELTDLHPDHGEGLLLLDPRLKLLHALVDGFVEQFGLRRPPPGGSWRAGEAGPTGPGRPGGHPVRPSTDHGNG